MIALAFASALALAPLDEQQLILAVRGVESSDGQDMREGDMKLGRCLRSIGPYQIRISTARWLVRIGAVKGRDSCSYMRAMLRREKYANEVAHAYIHWMLPFVSTQRELLCGWNAGVSRGLRDCAYARKVLEAEREGRE